MAKYNFDDSEDGAVAPLLGEKNVTSLIERAGYVVAAAILLVVVLIMTTDIRCIAVQSLADFSVAMFALMFCSYFMYLNMYRNGMFAGEKLKEYKEVCAEYEKIRSEIKSSNVTKRLSEFCREYVENERISRIKGILATADISYDDFQKYKHMSRKQMANEGLFKPQILSVIMARRIRPIKLTPTMLIRPGKNASRRNAMHMTPEDRRKWDKITKFVSNAASYGVAGVILFDIYTDLSWKKIFEVAFKLLLVVYTGYSGYMRGYDNIATDTVVFTRDQIDLLKQFMCWEASENEEQNNGKCAYAQ
jgi:hypothetical protein